MIPPRAVKQETSGHALRYRVAACRRRLRDRRATQSHEELAGAEQEISSSQRSAKAITENRISSGRLTSSSASEDMSLIRERLEESEEAEIT